jgi:hypothetical protein
MTEATGGFQKASRKAEVALPGHSFLLSFDAETTSLYFVPAKTSAKAEAGALPLATALVELARALVTQARLLTCPAGSDGLYYCETDLARFLEEAERMQEAGVGAEAQLTRPSEPLAPGLPSGLLHEAVTFALISALLDREYSLVMGRLVHRFAKSDPARPAATLAVRVDGAKTVSVTISCATLRGANRAASAALLMPGETRHALPACRTVQLRSLTDAMDPSEPLSGPQVLARYWRAQYGLGSLAGSQLVARVAFFSATETTLTYPIACLLSTALSLDEGHRPALAEREQRLQARLLGDIRGHFVFCQPERED